MNVLTSFLLASAKAEEFRKAYYWDRRGWKENWIMEHEMFYIQGGTQNRMEVSFTKQGKLPDGETRPKITYEIYEPGDDLSEPVIIREAVKDSIDVTVEELEQQEKFLKDYFAASDTASEDSEETQ